MTNIPEDIMAKAQELLEINLVMGDVDDDTAVFIVAGLLGDISAALLSERTAQEAEISRLKNKLVAAWNAFGSPSPRTEKPVFDLDDLDHLSGSADGELDEQIRALEDQFAASKARVAKFKKTIEAFAEPRNWVMNGRFDPNSGNFDAITFARAALTPAKENTDATSE